MVKTKHKIQDLAPICFLAVVTIAFFGKAIYSGKTLYGGDFLFYFYPIKRFVYDYFCTNGSLPFWNPYLFSGIPFIPNMQASMFYPLGFLYYLLPTDMAYLYSTILHCILGTVFMYIFMRSLGCSATGSVLPGFIFVFNGYFIAHIYAGHLSFVQNYIWIPLIFFFAVKFMDTRKLKHVVSGGLILGIQILGGFPQIAFYTILSILLLCFYFACVNFKTGGFPYIFKISIGTLFLIIIGFFIAAIQLLPTYEFTQLSTRSGGVGYQFATMDSLPPRNLLTFLFPLLFGSPVDGSFWITSTTWEFWEYCGYVGIVGFSVILFAMRKLLMDRIAIFFVLLILTALFLAFGKYNPVSPFIYRLPGFNSFRIPTQILFLYVFSMAVLSGKALDALRNASLFQKNAKQIVFTILFILLPFVIWSSAFPDSFCDFISRHMAASETSEERIRLISSVVSRAVLVSYFVFMAFSACMYLREKKSITHGIFAGMLIGLSVIDLGSFSFPLIQTSDIRSLLKEGQALSHITGNSRISRSVINGRCFIENAGLWYNFHDIHGYDPLILSRYMEYINKSQGLPPDNKVVNLHYISHFDNTLIRMLNLEFVVDCEKSSIRKVTPFIPRCYIVHQMETKSRDRIIDFMLEKQFDPLNMVVFQNGDAPEDFIPRKPVQGNNESCKIIRYENNEIELVANLETSGFLVMSEINYPGWQAYVDGKRKKIYTGNYLFRTIPLEKGYREIRLVFRPLSFKIGAFISAISLVGTILLILLFYTKRRSNGA